MNGPRNDPHSDPVLGDVAWQELMTELIDHVPDLVRDFKARFGPVGAYVPGSVSGDDLEETATDTMRMLVLQLAGRPVPDELAALPRSLGARRARQGVPLDLLLEAVRLDFKVIWTILQQLAGGGSEALLVRHVERVLTTVETFVSEVQLSFLREEAVLRRDSRLLVARYVSRLFNTDLTRAEVVPEIAEGLGVEADARFEVILVVGEGIVTAQELLSRPDAVRWFGYDQGAGYCLFRQQRHGARLPALLLKLPGGYVENVEGLAEVPAAATAAALLAQHRTSSRGLMSVSSAWPGVARTLLERGIPGFSRRVWQPLERSTPQERERLLEVVVEYARTGSIKETAQRLFCHRNTVVNRLRSFQELTGLDMTVPLEASMALCALGDGAGRRI